MRNIGVPLAHSIISYKAILRGLDKLTVNQKKINTELDNKKINQDVIINFIDNLKITDNLKKDLKKLTPFNYTGRS